LPTSAAALAAVPLSVPAADQGPGPYLVQASLFDTSTSPPTRLGTTCLPYTVGAPGDALNLGALPDGAGSGGPSDPRGVALNAQLGLSGLRALSFSWSTFLPQCNPQAPTASTCGPKAMTFAQAPESYFQAAALAAADHVTYWVQVSGGEPLSLALVRGGFWQGDVAALVDYYSQVPAGCSPCAPVTNWEPWNEPNNTGFPNAVDYVQQVLAPFYAAVKSVEPGATSTVVGGSTLEPSVGWWQALVAAGGLADMDVAAVHPYTGNNDAFEEDGMQAQVSQLESVLSGKPLWFTEVGWWSDGDYNFLGQADSVARAMIWMKVLHVPVWHYFFDEGSWGNDGVSFSLVQATGSDDYVKPAALATMTASGELAGRSLVATPAVGIPQAYAATFSVAPGGTTGLTALWTDGLPVTSAVTVTAPGGGTVPVTLVSEYGSATSSVLNSGQPYALPLASSVSYVLYPAGDTLSAGPTVPYGPNLALASSGAVATPSSGNGLAAVDGLQTGTGQGWSSAQGDLTPSLTVTLPGAPTVDRVVVDTQSNGSVAASLRKYTVAVETPGGGWQTVENATSDYRYHEREVDFPPTVAVAVRVSVSEVNFGGYYGG
ncbi:MAG TPA: discoidin domain-containing protein, partial [Acidimicrobiales bacterium]|nr:discoidin domain-containing protein [Acidimicrobiales bacterium]